MDIVIEPSKPPKHVGLTDVIIVEKLLIVVIVKNSSATLQPDCGGKGYEKLSGKGQNCRINHLKQLHLCNLASIYYRIVII